MKRLIVACMVVAELFASASIARASSSSGTAQIQWTSSASANLSIVTQYNTSFVQGTAAPTILASTAGVCAAPPSETAFTLTFGALSPSSTASTACLYKNAIAVQVQTNDAAGFSVSQYLDSAPTSGVGICAYPNGGSSFPLAPVVAPVSASTRTGNPAAGTFTGTVLSSCAAGGSVVPTGTGGSASGGTVPGNPGTGGLAYYSPSGSALGLLSSATPTVSGGSVVNMYGAEDVQVNLNKSAGSTTAAQTGLFLTLELVVN
ncbi:MAG TPA: hypothetical protein VHT05_12700 [Candidatus Elarobacter sp.]|nr:hypothetical protein [Candidatus Elarobacter sp.]